MVATAAPSLSADTVAANSSPPGEPQSHSVDTATEEKNPEQASAVVKDDPAKEVAAKEVVTPPEEAEVPQVTDLMSALRKSLDQAKAKADFHAPARPTRIKKPSTAEKRSTPARSKASTTLVSVSITPRTVPSLASMRWMVGSETPARSASCF